MGTGQTSFTEIFSWTVIAVSLAFASGLAMGRATEQAMHPRLSADPPSDPVERFALGQNAYAAPHVRNRSVRARPAARAPSYANAGDEIGRYKKGARLLIPSEPARKRDRLRLERLQAWNDENFGTDAGLVDEPVDYAEQSHPPIDVGAVVNVPDSGAPAPHIGMDGGGT